MIVKARMSSKRAVKTILVTWGTDADGADSPDPDPEETPLEAAFLDFVVPA